ncbi:MAG: CYTH domain-containing protein [Hyphomicrobiaceae bacterium]|nr:CYTH domain-containing protein [Hyphomicrobiaceae bacterium]
MAREIERKFLVTSDSWRHAATSSRRLQQYYLTRDRRSSVRVRIDGETRAWLTIKSAESGLARDEFEYAIPVDDARAMVPLAEGAVIDKVRHIVPHAGYAWEIDVFAGDNAGLIIAEVELPAAGASPELPAWVGQEITADRRYYNASLAQQPYNTW